ncbi:MAG: hypothetical protein JWR83_2777 [Aeromicrobium sp.]|nr:hypothetical protein [Aeromicrobium sp.]
MTVIIGERKPRDNGVWCELHFYVGDRAVSTVRDTAIASLTVKERASAPPFMYASLSIDEPDQASFVHGAQHVDVVVGRTDGEPTTLIRATVDYVQTVKDRPGEPTQISLQARSRMSPLIDNGYRGMVYGNIDAVVQAVCGAFSMSPTVDVEPVDLRLYSDTSSAYGTLRLLAVELDASTQVERDGTVIVRSNERERARVAKQTPVKLDASGATNLKVSRGKPIRGIE